MTTPGNHGLQSGMSGREPFQRRRREGNAASAAGDRHDRLQRQGLVEFVDGRGLVGHGGTPGARAVHQRGADMVNVGLRQARRNPEVLFTAP